MEIPVSAMPALLRERILLERKKLIEDGILKEETIETFHLYSEGLQKDLLDWVETTRKPMIQGMGAEYDFIEEYPNYKAPEDYKDKVEAVRIAFTRGTMGSRERVAETLEEASETKTTMESELKPKSEDEVKRESVISAFTNRTIVEETK